ncbi:MAG: type II toxin-antitoxin system RatA family toxin [Gammaproteobacteria bacterium]|nr:type II toxin-antitoxin system RatA family toxin [Gammaproteobacteria bacterium]NIR82975.1 type II toxin-antitoxin system RatA family toxin [Gammaproteobacteria bacterium]
MTTIRRSAVVPYSPPEMFALVDDIESYPEFLPWCRSARVHSRDADEVRATIELARGAVHKSFTTCNRLQRNKMIEVRLVEGPFRHLEGFWRFDAMQDDACQVLLDMDFEFANRLIGLAVGPVFHQVAGSLVDAFKGRAVDVYGHR